MSHPMFKYGLFLAPFIIINLELYESQLDILTDILLTLLLAGQ
jgi:hypothetical protein